jgi:prepilin-type processing-associated H-X9-DG protein
LHPGFCCIYDPPLSVQLREQIMTTRAKVFLIVGGVLLVVVLIGTVFLSVLFIGISNARRAALRTTCATRLKSLGSCVAVYAASYNDALPTFSGPAGTWMCDQSVDWPAVGALSAAMSPKLSFPDLNYCPANNKQDPGALWGGAAATHRVTGYIWTNDRPGMPSLAGLRTAPALEYHKKFIVTRGASETELALDWIISDKPTAAGASWTGITAAGRPGVYDTSHLVGKSPAGGNALLFDGHVEWRAFDAGKSPAVPQTPAGPAFWFPGK